MFQNFYVLLFISYSSQVDVSPVVDFAPWRPVTARRHLEGFVRPLGKCPFLLAAQRKK